MKEDLTEEEIAIIQQAIADGKLKIEYEYLGDNTIKMKFIGKK